MIPETKVFPTSPVVSVVLVVKPIPTPFSATTLRVKILDPSGQPVQFAMINVLDQKGKDLGNWYARDVVSDKHGIIEKTVPTGGTYTIQVDGGSYPRMEKKVVSKPGVIPMTIVLKRP